MINIASFAKFTFTPDKNEQIETVVRLKEESRSVIHGIVVDCENKPIKDAVVKLFEVKKDRDHDCDCDEDREHKECNFRPITHVFTDECGQFIFGPLCPCKKYLIKVYKNTVTVRFLELPNPCNKPEPPCKMEPIHGKPDCHDGCNEDC